MDLALVIGMNFMLQAFLIFFRFEQEGPGLLEPPAIAFNA